MGRERSRDDATMRVVRYHLVNERDIDKSRIRAASD
jgi:hypothetical protein